MRGRDPISSTDVSSAEQRFELYLREIGSLLHDRRRGESFAMYACGLFGEGDRRSADPVAVRLRGDRLAPRRRTTSCCTFLGRSEWDDRPIRIPATRFGIK